MSTYTATAVVNDYDVTLARRENGAIEAWFDPRLVIDLATIRCPAVREETASVYLDVLCSWVSTTLGVPETEVQAGTMLYPIPRVRTQATNKQN